MSTRSATARASAPPEPPSPITVATTGTLRRAILSMRLGDGARLAALLGGDARVRAGRVDEREHRQAVPLGEREQPLRLAVALRPRHAEVVLRLLVERAALLVADDEHGAAAEPAEPADDGRVVGAQAVALELLEAVDQIADVVARARPVLVARDLDRDPGVMATALPAGGSSASPGASRSPPTNGRRA